MGQPKTSNHCKHISNSVYMGFPCNGHCNGRCNGNWSRWANQKPVTIAVIIAVTIAVDLGHQPAAASGRAAGCLRLAAGTVAAVPGAGGSCGTPGLAPPSLRTDSAQIAIRRGYFPRDSATSTHLPLQAAP